MLKEDMLKIVKELGTIEDDAERREKLVSFSEELEKDYTNLEELTSKNDNLNKEVTRLQEKNMELFLRIGEPKSNEGKRVDSSSENETVLKYEDLFNEKGELK